MGTSSGSASSRAQVLRDQESEQEVMKPPREDARNAKASKGKGQGHGYKFCEHCNFVHHYKTPHLVAQDRRYKAMNMASGEPVDRLGKESAEGARIEAVAIGEERLCAHALFSIPRAESPRREVTSAADNRSRRPRERPRSLANS